MVRWLTRLPIGDTPARFTKELRLTQRFGVWLRPRILDSHLQLLSAFSNIQKLVITNIVVSVFEPGTLQTYFGLVFPLVLDLRLLHPVGCPLSLLHFISAFPKAISLDVQNPRWIGPVGGDHLGPVRWADNNTCISGVLYLRGFGVKSDEFISLLAEQPIKFRQIKLLECAFSGGPAIQKLLDATSTTLQTLQVVPSGKSEWKATTKREVRAYESIISERAAVGSVYGPEGASNQAGGRSLLGGGCGCIKFDHFGSHSPRIGVWQQG